MRTLLIAAMFIASGLASERAYTSDILAEGFRSPPREARPLVWWHWIEGNVTKDGIRRDLKWMKRIGVGGVQKFDVAFEWPSGNDPREAKKGFRTQSPKWGEAVIFAIRLAHRLNLEFGIASSPGFSETGGPWVRPEEGMKKLVWSETQIQGGRRFKGTIRKPPETTGLFQNIPLVELSPRGFEIVERPQYYRDVATVAYRIPLSESATTTSYQVTTGSGNSIDSKLLADGDLAATAIEVRPEKDGNAWIQFSFSKAVSIQGVTIVVGGPFLGVNSVLEARQSASLEACDKNNEFYKISDIPTDGAPEQTVAFAPVSSKMFRVVLHRPPKTLVEEVGLTRGAETYRVSELVLHPGARINRFEDKAGYSTRPIRDQDDTPSVRQSEIVHKDDIVNLSERISENGELEWMPPPGRWNVLRFGYSLIGRTNNPASRKQTGLEVDKLNARHVANYMARYLRMYRKAMRSDPRSEKSFDDVLIDSYESGAQNWTDDMLDQFARRRGYSAIPWLPALAGRVIEGADASDRFLWDFRKTLEELIADSHYGQISAYLHKHGMRLYAESHEVGRAFIGDGMSAKRTADVPMGAMWANRVPGISQGNYDVDLREAASVAHIYGKSIVAAESFTSYTSAESAYSAAPDNLKPIADRELAMGVNRFVIHTSVHQPTEQVGPGIGLGPFGQWFNRKETWASVAGSWVDYLTRSSYLLQQGRFVADVAILYGEDTNLTASFNSIDGLVPPGYNFDFVNPEALVSEFSVENNMLVTHAGMRYRMLVLDSSTRKMSLPLLKAIQKLLQAGALIVGPRPIYSPSLADDRREFNRIRDELWEGAGVKRHTVISTRPLERELKLAGISADVMFDSHNSDLRFVHRSLLHRDIYFVTNSTTRSCAVEASFRVSGRIPELWSADTGQVRRVAYRSANGRTILSLNLEPQGAIFVVFREGETQGGMNAMANTAIRAESVDGPWDVTFPPHLGASSHVRFDTLKSWTESNDAGVKYFSGTATYRKVLRLSREGIRADEKVWLDLGTVKNVAEVIVNGKPVGVLWKHPFKIDVSNALRGRGGGDLLEIKVTNLWRNRLIGDLQPGAKKIAFASFNPFKMDSPLLVSGLIGPVTLVFSKGGSGTSWIKSRRAAISIPAMHRSRGRQTQTKEIVASSATLPDGVQDESM